MFQECNLSGKPIYVTRVVDTMTDAPRPTRAEATGEYRSHATNWTHLTRVVSVERHLRSAICYGRLHFAGVQSEITD